MTTLVWVDDQPNKCHVYEKMLAQVSDEIQLTIVDNMDEGQDLVDRGHVDGVVTDLNMEKTSHEETGADWIKRLSNDHLSLPTFVVSGFADDERYESALIESFVIAKHHKNSDIISPYKKDPFLSKIAYFSNLFNKLKHFRPQEIEFNDFVVNPAKFKEAVDAHWSLFRNSSLTHMNRNAHEWLLILGGKIHASSPRIEDFPDDEDLYEIGKKSGLIPFAYTYPHFPEIIEDGGWRPCEKQKSYYPQLQIELDNKRYFEDFDTGAAKTLVSDALVKPSILNMTQDSSIGSHTGEEFKFFPKNIILGVVSNNGHVKKNKINVQVVDDWRTSSFVKIHSERNALIGRDVLHQYGLEVLLDGKNKKTVVKI